MSTWGGGKERESLRLPAIRKYLDKLEEVPKVGRFIAFVRENRRRTDSKVDPVAAWIHAPRGAKKKE